jgi:hypothetical protein
VPPQDIVRAARIRPGAWLRKVDPAWRSDNPPPRWAIVGRWRSGSTGEIEEWEANPEYRPSPQALGLPEPTDPVDTAVQLASTGYGAVEEVARRLVGTDVAVPVDASGIPRATPGEDGTPVLTVYTSASQIEAAGHTSYDLWPVAPLLEHLPENGRLRLNPTAAVTMLVEPETLRAALAAVPSLTAVAAEGADEAWDDAGDEPTRRLRGRGASGGDLRG